MGAKWQRVRIKVPDYLTPIEREALAIEILDFIRTRTQDKGLDKNGDKFKRYSDSYQKSLNFKIAGKSKSVNLTLSGDMLGAMDLLSHKSGEILIGFEKGTPENDRADGNIRGTYGSDTPDKKKARDFLGISPSDLKTLLKNYPANQDNTSYAEDVLNVRMSQDSTSVTDQPLPEDN